MSALRSIARRTVPLGARQLVAEARRRSADRANGVRFADETSRAHAPVYATIEQTIGHGELYDNKVANIIRAIAVIDGSSLAPGETWSFWRRVGRPTASNGYLEGRSIRCGMLARELGGGLCQLSGLLHHLALAGGLEIAERHPHSIDIYREEDRYTPLGADATVVWGTKDLRLLNSRSARVIIGCRLDAPRLIAELRCEEVLRPRGVEFRCERVAADRARVRTIADGVEIAVSEYVQRPGLSLV